MKIFRIKHILTWVALFVLILDGLFLLVAAWNTRFDLHASPALLIMLWILLITTSIYLFYFAVKQTLADYLHHKEEALKQESQPEPAPSGTTRSQERDRMDLETKLRKILRGISHDNTASETGKIILENLAKELEIMSGIVYFRNEKGDYIEEANYASVRPGEVFSFREGEGLSGQVAKNKQVSLFSKLPEEYMQASSGLGKSASLTLAIIPIVIRNNTDILIECTCARYEMKELERLFRLFSKNLTELMTEKNNT
jgi:hypothetical protein